MSRNIRYEYSDYSITEIVAVKKIAADVFNGNIAPVNDGIIDIGEFLRDDELLNLLGDIELFSDNVILFIELVVGVFQP